jgi:hypothetical protein
MIVDTACRCDAKAAAGHGKKKPRGRAGLGRWSLGGASADQCKHRKAEQTPKRGASAPEVFEAIGRHLGVADGVLDVLVAEVGLKGAGIVPLVGQGEAAGMA